MNETTMALLTGLIGTVFATVPFGAAIGGAWLLGRDHGRRSAEAASRARPADGSVAAGTAEQASIVRALEGLTLEVERLSEAQRCAGRLLVEGRQARDAAGVTEIGRPPERVVTPR